MFGHLCIIFLGKGEGEVKDEMLYVKDYRFPEGEQL